MMEGSWIKRSQELPPDGQEVLGWFVAEEGALEVEDGYMLVQWSEYENAFNDENAFNIELFLRGEITHWQCLPVPPKCHDGGSS